MILRWLHKIWVYFWFLLIAAVSFAGFAILLTWALLQFGPVQNKLAGYIETQFNESFAGELEIGKLSGRLPFHILIEDAKLNYLANEEELKTLVHVPETVVTIDYQSLLRGEFRISKTYLNRPEIAISNYGDAGSSVTKVFTAVKPKSSENIPEEPEDILNIPSFVLAMLQIQDGNIQLEGFELDNNVFKIPPFFAINNFSVELGLEVSDDFYFLNVFHLAFLTPQFDQKEWTLSGQIFADDRFLEFNALRINTPDAFAELTLIFDGVNAAHPQLEKQIQEADFTITGEFAGLDSNDFVSIFPILSDYNLAAAGEFEMSGNSTFINISLVDIIAGESRVRLFGEIPNPLESSGHAYSVTLDYLNVHNNEIQQLSNFFKDIQFDDWGLLTIRGLLEGNEKEHKISLEVNSPGGDMDIESNIVFAADTTYSFALKTDFLDIAPFKSLNQPNAQFGGIINLTGKNVELGKIAARLQLELNEIRWDDYYADSINLTADLTDGFIEPEFTVKSGTGEISGSGWIDLLAEDIVTRFNGVLTNINIRDFYLHQSAPDSDLSIRYDLNLTGMHLDRVSGDVFLGLTNSFYRGEPVENHEIILSLDSPDQENRTLKIAGSLMEAELSGSLIPSRLIDATAFWAAEINQMIQERTVFTDTDIFTEKPFITRTLKNDVSLQMRFRIDDLTLLNSFIPGFPKIDTITNLDIDIKADNDQVRIDGDIASDFIDAAFINADSLSTKFSVNLTRDKKTDFLITDFKSSFRSLTAGGITLEDAVIDIDGYDEAFVLQEFKALMGDNMEIGIMLSAVFSTFDVDIRIMDFFVGDDSYSWVNISESPVVIDRNGKIVVDNLEFANQGERVKIGGIFSESSADSVYYTFSNFDLRAISDLFASEAAFSGIMNGVFSTKTLKTAPEFQGEVNIASFEIDQRLVGDIDFESIFNPDDDRFDILLTVYTDPEEYADYLETSGDVGKNIDISGFISTPAGADAGSPLALFNFDFKELDLWVLPYLASGIFNEINGLTTGSGTLEIAQGGFSYDANFQVENVRVVPVFLNSTLFLNGSIDMNSENGVVFNDVRVNDTRGGTGTLSGSIMVGDFASIMPMDLTLDMNRLQFLDNSYEPDIPFFGRAAGTGRVHLGGTDRSPYITTPIDVSVTSNSTITIPIETDQHIDQRARFITFVDSFDEVFSAEFDQLNGRTTDFPELTFMEQFQLDMRFRSTDNMNVRLMFDRVTNEVMSARGTGDIQFLLRDQEFSVFGRFDVTGGEYNFVGGDIFSRRFTIRDEGSIIWEGDPVNARVDVTAAYRARPDLSILRPEISDLPQRVPIELILEITGTLESIENDFYFEFSSGIDASLTPTYLAILNSEEQKLVQATSLLFTGSFIPVEADTRETGGPLQGRAGQIGLGTLLSAQINNLLNSNLSNLDIDLNLTGLDQADLGVALRLFDDRLTLRREGVVTGPDANFGDIDLTYRINRVFSVEVFHRRDPLLMGVLTAGQNQFESINGIGLEARVQFHTWGELSNRIWRSVSNTFAIGRQAKKDEEDVAVAN